VHYKYLAGASLQVEEKQFVFNRPGNFLILVLSSTKREEQAKILPLSHVLDFALNVKKSRIPSYFRSL
jgi:hypothetical protein